MPRNWQPPPGEAQARQPRSAASSSVTSSWAKRAPSVCTAPASSPRVGGSVTPPGTIAPASSRNEATAISIAGRPLSQVPTPITPRRSRQAAHEAAQHERGVVAVGERVEHARRALGAPVARVGDVGGERQPAEPVELLGRLAHEQADLPVARVVAERDRRAVVGPHAAQGREDEELVAPDLGRLPAHAGVLGQPEDVAGGPLLQERRPSAAGPRRALPPRLDLEEVVVAARPRPAAQL